VRTIVAKSVPIHLRCGGLNRTVIALTGGYIGEAPP